MEFLRINAEDHTPARRSRLWRKGRWNPALAIADPPFGMPSDSRRQVSRGRPISSHASFEALVQQRHHAHIAGGDVGRAKHDPDQTDAISLGGGDKIMTGVAGCTGLQAIGPSIARQKAVDGRQLSPPEVHAPSIKEME